MRSNFDNGDLTDNRIDQFFLVAINHSNLMYWFLTTGFLYTHKSWLSEKTKNKVSFVVGSKNQQSEPAQDMLPPDYNIRLRQNDPTYHWQAGTAWILNPFCIVQNCFCNCSKTVKTIMPIFWPMRHFYIVRMPIFRTDLQSMS